MPANSPKTLKPKLKTKAAVTTTVKKATVAKAPAKTKSTGLSVPTYSLAGVSSGSMELPKAIFAGQPNQQLVAQALRVYTNNQKSHFGNTKTRGEVAGSTIKMGRQKGSGRARHGSRRAPIYVHGGIAMGPKYRKVVLDLPKKMKQAALISALRARALSGEILGLTGLEKASGKTKQWAQLLTKLQKTSVLLVVSDEKSTSATRAIRNIPGSSAVGCEQLNILEVVNHQTIIFAKEAVEKLATRLSNKKESA